MVFHANAHTFLNFCSFCNKIRVGRYLKLVPSHRHRGVSTIVGGIIFLVLLTAGFSTFFVAMDVQSDTADAYREMSDLIRKKTQEQFSIATATDDNNNYQLGIQVKNEGPNPVQISNIWIINKSLPNQPAKSIPIDHSDAFIPAAYGLPILQNQLLKMDDPLLTPGNPDLYDIKVVSTLGTIKQTELNVGGNNYLKAELYTIPPDVHLNENVTIALRVTNIGKTLVTDVTPDNIPPIVDNPGWVDIFELVSPLSVDLEPTESTIFSWDVTLSNTGTVGAKLQFTDSVSGIESLTGYSVSSNTASNKITVREDETGESVVIETDLHSKPEIQVILPAPFGDLKNGSTDKGLWGVNVANPTESIMNVTKVVFTAIDPEGGGGFHMFKKGQCFPQNISPPPLGGPGKWFCDLNNQLTWMDTVNPVQIPPRSVVSFLVKIQANSIGGGDKDLQSMPIQITVVTSSGQFGKAGYDSSVSASNDVLANIFVGNGLGTINNNNVNSIRTGIITNSIQTFDIWLVDFGTDSEEKIKGKNPNNKLTSLIINVPQDWEVQLPLPPSNDANWKMVYYSFPDGSSQIIGKLKNDLWNDGRKITFDVKAPIVADKKMYVMHALANGISEDDFTVSPLTEIVLQVIP